MSYLKWLKTCYCRREESECLQRERIYPCLIGSCVCKSVELREIMLIDYIVYKFKESTFKEVVVVFRRFLVVVVVVVGNRFVLAWIYLYGSLCLCFL